MKQIYSAKNSLEAHDLRLFLESHGITAKVLGDANVLDGVLGFTPGAEPGVFVSQSDLALAAELLDGYKNPADAASSGERWTCTNCGQQMNANFNACWKCEFPREEPPAEAPRHSADAIDRRPAEKGIVDSAAKATDVPIVEIYSGMSVPNDHNLWFGVLALLAVAWFPFVSLDVLDWLYPTAPSDWPFIADQLWGMVSDVSIAAVVLYIIYRHGRPWSAFGICRPRWARDIGLAVSVYVATFALLGVLYSWGVAVLGTAEMERLSTSTFEFKTPNTLADLIIVIVASLATGLSEELAMRGYLLPTLERLMRSTTKSVFATSLIFASAHLYQGMGAAVWIFLGALIFACAFVLIRRLWPLVLAHAAWNIVAFWPT